MPAAVLTQLRLCLLFTPTMCRRDPWSTLDDALAGGVDLVQWRVPDPTQEGLERCLRACRARGVPLIVNDHVDRAVDVGADGAHVGQGDMAAAAARRRLGPERWLGVSTHDAAQIDAAIDAGADYLGFGPTFPTETKGYAEGQAPGNLRAAVARSRRPVFAIGGITPDNVGTVLAQGAQHIAVSSCILHAASPRLAAQALREALDATAPGSGQSTSIASPKE